MEAKGKSAFMKAKLLKRLSSQDIIPSENINNEKENLNSNKAAVVIQSRECSFSKKKKKTIHLPFQEPTLFLIFIL